AQYTNIPPGNYTFQVRASNNDGFWSPAVAAFPFYLRPHFYQTGWFFAFCAALLILIVWRVHVYRISRALEIERIRTRIASDLHDDIGAGLSQIAVISEVLRQDVSNTGAEFAEKLSKISDTSHELIGSMSDIVWAVNPKRDRVEDLVQRMRKFSSDVLSNSNFQYDFEASDFDGTKKLSPDFKRHVYLIFKESVHNIVKHSGGNSVKMGIAMDNGRLNLTIQDNGKGFSVSDPSMGHGIKSMQQRAALLG